MKYELKKTTVRINFSIPVHYPTLQLPKLSIRSKVRRISAQAKHAFRLPTFQDLRNQSNFALSFGLHLAFALIIASAHLVVKPKEKPVEHFIEVVNFPKALKPVKVASQAIAPAAKMPSASQTRPVHSATSKAAKQSQGLSSLLAQAKKAGRVERAHLSPTTEKSPQGLTVEQKRFQDKALASAGTSKALLNTLNTGRTNEHFKWDTFKPAKVEGKEIAAVDYSQIIKTLSKYQNEFRDCYEKALLIDESLSGHAELTMDLSDSANVSRTGVLFTGAGKTSGQDSLQKCLSHTTSKLKFPKTLAGQQLIFRLLLKS